MMGTYTLEQTKMLALLTVECLVESANHQQRAEAILRQFDTDAAHRQWLDAARHWHHMRKYWLKAATQTLRGGIPQKWWTEGKAMAEG